MMSSTDYPLIGSMCCIENNTISVGANDCPASSHRRRGGTESGLIDKTRSEVSGDDRLVLKEFGGASQSWDLGHYQSSKRRAGI